MPIQLTECIKWLLFNCQSIGIICIAPLLFFFGSIFIIMSTTIHNLLFDSLCFGGYVPQTDSLVTNKNGNSEFRNETDSVKCLRYRRCSNSRFPVQFCEIRFLKSCLDETYSWDLHLTSSKYFPECDINGSLIPEQRKVVQWWS